MTLLKMQNYKSSFIQSIRTQSIQIIFLLVAVFFISSLPSQGLVFPSVQDSSHTIVFFWGCTILLNVWFSTLKIKPKRMQIIGVCVLAFLLGVVIEFIQPYFGRNKSLVDAYNDFAGCSAAGFLFWRLQIKQASHKRFCLLFACILIVSGLIQPIKHLQLLWQRNTAMPVLFNFEAAWEKNLWTPNDGTNVEILKGSTVKNSIDLKQTITWLNETNFAKITFKRGVLYPGISFPFIYNDWHDYSLLTFEVFWPQGQTVPNKEIQLHLRIHDTEHNNDYDDRFNRILMVKPGLNVFEISLEDVKSAPKSRLLKLKAVDSMSIFLIKPKEDIMLYVDNFVLH